MACRRWEEAWNAIDALYILKLIFVIEGSLVHFSQTIILPDQILHIVGIEISFFICINLLKIGFKILIVQFFLAKFTQNVLEELSDLVLAEKVVAVLIEVSPDAINRVIDHILKL